MLTITVNGKPAQKSSLFHGHYVYCDGGIAKQLEAKGHTGRIALRTEQEKGRGYKGGHSHAAVQDWPVIFPRPKKGAVAFLEISRMGRWQGLRPETISFFLID